MVLLGPKRGNWGRCHSVVSLAGFMFRDLVLHNSSQTLPENECFLLCAGLNTHTTLPLAEAVMKAVSKIVEGVAGVKGPLCIPGCTENFVPVLK